MNVGVGSFDAASTAQIYAEFSGILTGLAFSGLCRYLQRRSEPCSDTACIDPPARRIRHARDGGRRIDHVTTVLLYSMASLAMVSLLYTNLAGQPEPHPTPAGPPSGNVPGAAIMSLLPYGVVFGLATLTLFHGIVLMMFEHLPTTKMAEYTDTVISIAGPLVVVRLLAEAARNAWQVKCAAQHCRSADPGGVLSTRGMTILLASILLTSVFMSWIGRSQRRPFRLLRAWLAHHRTAPAAAVFAVTLAVSTEGALYLATRSASYIPSDWLIYSILAAGTLLTTASVMTHRCIIGHLVTAARTGIDADPAADQAA